jgi:hypothetical protein
LAYPYDGTSPSVTKTNRKALPVGASVDQYIRAEDWNTAAQDIIDLGNSLKGGEYHGLSAASAAAVSGAGAARLRANGARLQASQDGEAYRTVINPVRFDVRDYGAVADTLGASATNRTAIQNALTAAANIKGGYVYFPKGTWYIDDTIHVNGVDSVAIEGFGPPILWEAHSVAGGYTQIAGDNAFNTSKPLIRIENCDGVRVRNMRLHGNGRAAYGVDVLNSSALNPSRNNTIEHVLVTATTVWGIQVGSSVNSQCDFTLVRDFAVVSVTSGGGIRQYGAQTVHNRYEFGYVGGFVGGYGMDFESGDVRVHHVDFQGGGLADVRIQPTAYWAHFENCYHETNAGTPYLLPTTTGRNYATTWVSCRVQFNQTSGRIIDYNQTGPCTTVGCTWQTYASDGSQDAKVRWNGQNGGAPPYVTEIGTAYLNGADPEVSAATCYRSTGVQNPFDPSTDLLASIGPGIAPVGDEMFLRTLLRFYESAVRFEDNQSAGNYIEMRSVYNMLQIKGQDGVPIARFAAGGGWARYGEDKSATPGNVTINKHCGIAAIPAGGNALTITNSLCTTASGRQLRVGVMSNDTTLKTVAGVMLSGSLQIWGNANATADTKVWFEILDLVASF